MKKKQYIQPSAVVLEVESNSVVMTSGPALTTTAIKNDEEVDAASYRNNLWN